MNKLEIKQFQDDLLAWYDEFARDLPWRNHPTPYQVWVSEIMLQQTRVEAVKPYYERFIKQYPDIKALSQADDDALHKVWEGLGYYSRVRNMKKCAQQCMDLYDGCLPTSASLLKTLSGIGDYTAGAIASIAYKEVVPAVDGNVLRVFSRLLVCEDDILSLQTKRKFQGIIQAMMPCDRPDAFNQAVMEIGAMICVPNAAPRCNICPLSKYCLGYQQGKASYLPIKKAKAKRKLVSKTIIVVVKDHQVGIVQRANTGLLASLYEFLSIDEFMSKQAVMDHFVSQGYKISKLVKLPSSIHVFTHLEWRMRGFLMVCDEIGEDCELRFVSASSVLHQYAFPTALKVYKEGVIAYLDGEETE